MINEFDKLRALRVPVPYVLPVTRALVSYMSRVWRASCSTCCRTLGASYSAYSCTSFPTCSSILFTSCPTCLVSYMVLYLTLYELFFLTYPIVIIPFKGRYVFINNVIYLNYLKSNTKTYK